MFRTFLQAAAVAGFCAVPAFADTIIVVQTSDNVGGAGTDSNIYVRLFDGNGQTRRLRLQDLPGATGNMMESGAFDILTITDNGVETAPLRIQVESDGAYSGSDWHLDRIHAFTYDADDVLAFSLATVAATTLRFVEPDLENLTSNGVYVSTFVHEGWIEGDETFMAENTMQDGVSLSRSEQVVTTTGSPEEVETTIYVVYSADALDSASAVARAWLTTISRNRSFLVASEDSQEGSFGASVTVGWAPPETGGAAYGEATISAEYSFLTADSREQTWGTESTVATDDTFEAAPGTVQFRILETRGVIAQQVYQSMIQNETFSGIYIQEASPFVPRGVTFTSGENGDEVWNRSVARAYAVNNGESGYNLMLDRLRAFGIIDQAMSFNEVMGN